MVFEIERIERIIKDIKNSIYPDFEAIIKYKVMEGNFPGGEEVDLDDSIWGEYITGELWGGYDKHQWFRTDITIPHRFENKKVVFIITTGLEGEWDALNPQFMFYIDGKLVQGLDVNHREVLITQNAEAGRKYHIALLGYSGLNDRKTKINTELYVLDTEIEALYYNMNVPHSVAKLLNDQDVNRIHIVNKLSKAVNMLNLRRIYSQEFYNSVKMVNSYLEKEFYTHINHDCPLVTATGNSHIDVAWLWTLAQTREKTGRSISTVLNLMKQYPEYKFIFSQPQLYEFLKEDYPELYKGVKRRIEEKRWEADGVMWLEADCNIPSGESLVRQILFGMKFFNEELGVECKTLWLPDVFGYSAALPQMLKKSGINYFMTTKIDWNQFNTMPNDTFMWRGIDGSEVLTHFVTTSDYNKADGDKVTFTGSRNKTTYTGNINASQVMGTWQRYQNKDINEEVLMLFGFGDGGGGPTKEMLENAKRFKYGIPGCPRLEIGLEGDFFDRIYEKLSNDPKLPKWVGELYLEYHRGTYTSMGIIKRYNRKSEFLYEDAEMLSTADMLIGGTYPVEKINMGWKTILLNQFHDILPGSSIKQVYDEAINQYEDILDKGKNIVYSALKHISANVKIDEDSIIVFNTLSYDRDDIVEAEVSDDMDIKGLVDGEGNAIMVQSLEEPAKIIFFAKGVPSKGYKIYRIIKDSIIEDYEPLIGSNYFENSFFSVKFDEDYNITSIYDKSHNREMVRDNEKANQLQAFEDRPMLWENWDIDIFYREKMWEINDLQDVRVVENGPVRYCIKTTRKFLESSIIQYIYIYRDIPRIDFKTCVDWREKNILLKAAFPIDINANKATYEIQYGNIERTTHENTSWDLAKFEVCAHKWADLSEGGYGISLLNDCKYGHEIKNGVMRLTLLKSGTYPNPEADLGYHEFTYSLYPHQDTWKEGGTQRMAYNINVPMYSVVESVHNGMLPDKMSLAWVNVENCIIEVVKRAENGEGIIIRAFEYMNKRTNAELVFGFKIKEAYECDLLENIIESIDSSEYKFNFEIKPYEIKTFLVKPKSIEA